MTERVDRFLAALRAFDELQYVEVGDGGRAIIDGWWTKEQIDAALETALRGTDDDAVRAMR